MGSRVRANRAQPLPEEAAERWSEMSKEEKRLLQIEAEGSGMLPIYICRWDDEWEVEPKIRITVSLFPRAVGPDDISFPSGRPRAKGLTKGQKSHKMLRKRTRTRKWRRILRTTPISSRRTLSTCLLAIGKLRYCIAWELEQSETVLPGDSGSDEVVRPGSAYLRIHRFQVQPRRVGGRISLSLKSTVGTT